MPPSETAAANAAAVEDDGRLVWLDTPSEWRLALRDFSAPAPDR